MIKIKIKTKDGHEIEAEGSKKEILSLVKEVLKSDVIKGIEQEITIPFNYNEKLWVCDHDFPNPWFGTVPPHCKKCGQQAEMLTPWTVTSGQITTDEVDLNNARIWSDCFGFIGNGFEEGDLND